MKNRSMIMAGLDDPAKKEIAMQIVSTNENSSKDWRAQYSYIEDIDDGRGYTAGIVGFCSGTGDMLELVQYYDGSTGGRNILSKYLSALKWLAEHESDSHEGLDPTFKPDWKAAAKDRAFQDAQNHERDRVYFDPAVSQGKEDGLGILGQFIYYDAIVMHGSGDDFSSFDSIRARAMENAETPAQGGDEATYLNAFLDARLEAMDEDGHSDNKDRVETEQRPWVKQGNLNLDTPLSWDVNGETFEISESDSMSRGAAPEEPEEGLTPGELLDIGASRGSHYEVQVAPTGASEIVIHHQDEIEAGYSEDPYFVVTPDGTAVQFYTRMDAPTTPNSSYPRSELREVKADGSKMEFDPFAGVHRLSGRTRITHLPPNKPEVVIAQLHNGHTDRVAIRTQVISGDIRLVVRVNGHAVKPHLENSYEVGAEFGWMIEIDNGHVSVYYAEGDNPLPSTPIITSDELEPTDDDPPKWYFKAGAYAQSNADTDDPTEYVAVELRDLHTEHLA